MALGAFVEVLDFTASALCSLIMMFVFIEIGSPYTFFVWIATSVLGLIFFPHSLVSVTYFLIFGIYPILKAYIEKLKRVFWFIVKLAYFLVASGAMIAVSELVFDIPFFTDDLNIPFFESNQMLFRIIIFALLIAATFVYDIFLTVMARSYFSVLRDRIKRFLK
jgi:hypothetical protein